MTQCCTDQQADAGQRLFPGEAVDPNGLTATVPGPLWRAALRLVTAPALRLHRYRSLRTALLRKAVARLARNAQP